MKVSFESFILFFRSSYLKTEKHLSLHSKYLVAQTLIRSFYASLLFLAIVNLEDWKTYLGKNELQTLWPVSWLGIVDLHVEITIILVLNLVGGVLAVTLTQFRMVRVLVFLSLLEFYGLRYSFGKIGHGSHLAILISLFLIFLPQGWNQISQHSKLVKASVIAVFSSCQILIMLTYTMSGIGKVFYALLQGSRGEVNALMPKGLALTIANRLLETGQNSFLGDFFIQNYYAGWLLMLGAIYIQLFALWAAFRPSLHQVWGLSLIVFHISVYLTMTITFEQNCLWLAIFFLYSPFSQLNFDPKRILLDLPLLDLMSWKILKGTR